MLDRKSTTKAIASIEKIDNMLQRQIVDKALGNAIDIEDPAYPKSAIRSFHSISRCSDLSMLPHTGLDNHNTGHCIIATKLLRSCI